MPQAVLELVPRVRRAIEGAGAVQVLSDDAVKQLVADSLAAVLLYVGTVFGKKLIVTARDNTTNAPTDYAVDPELSLPEQTVIANQAALDYFFHEFRDKKTHETIQDEAQSWDYDLSPTLLRDQLKLLQAERDKSLDAILDVTVIDSYTSFLAVQDAFTSALIEPWVDPQLPSTRQIPRGQEDFRFGVTEPPYVGPTWY